MGFILCLMFSFVMLFLASPYKRPAMLQVAVVIIFVIFFIGIATYIIKMGVQC